jgi:hypothetical protein
MLRPLFAGALALFSGAASAELVTIRYDFPPIANYAFDWFYFGGERGPTTGHIRSTTLVVDYTTTDPQDAADFYLTFDVPTFDGEQTHIELIGADLGWSGQGEFTYTFTNDLYNGEIRPGGFGAQFSGGGTLTNSYIEFLVDADPLDPIFADGFDTP